MKSKTEKTLTEIIERIIQSGYTFQVSKRTVERAIMELRGIDDRTIRKWLKALVMFDYLKPVAVGVYQLNPLKVPDLFEVIKEKPQIKLQ